MLEHLRLQDILILDIETVPQYENYAELPERWQKLWNKKATRLAKDNEPPEELYQQAGIYAEFGKVICVSVGFFSQKSGKLHFRLKSYYGHDEYKLLSELAVLLRENYSNNGKFLCAHNGKEFDFPYLGRRMLVHEIVLPSALNLAGKKPWEVQHLDTMDLWKFGDYKSFTSLELLAALFDIPTPKDDIDGSMVREVYYADKDLERIKVYCEKDVVTLARVLLKMMHLPALTDEQVEVVE